MNHHLLIAVPFDSIEGVILSIGFFGTVVALVVAGFLSGRRKRYVPLSRRKGTKSNEKLRDRFAKERKAFGTRKHGRKRQKGPGPLAGLLPGGAPVDSPELEEPKGAGLRRHRTGSVPPKKRSFLTLFLMVAVAPALLVGGGIAAMSASLRSDSVSEVFLSPHFLLATFFILLFAVEFLPFRKLKYALIATLPVAGLIVLGFFVDLLETWPVLLAALGAVTCVCALILGIRERTWKFWSAWGRKVREGKQPGEKTAKALGRPDPRYDNARPGRHLDPAEQSKAKLIYFRTP